VAPTPILVDGYDLALSSKAVSALLTHYKPRRIMPHRKAKFIARSHSSFPEEISSCCCPKGASSSRARRSNGRMSCAPELVRITFAIAQPAAESQQLKAFGSRYYLCALLSYGAGFR
jgi:hypothetical protein